MGSLPRKLHLLLPPLLLLYTFLSINVSARNISIEFESFSFHNFTLLGDAYLRNGSIGLTLETGVPSSSSGTSIYNLPIQLYDPETNTSASFSTKFSFAITNSNADSFGDGLTFFISPDNQTLGNPGGYLGLFSSSGPVNNGSVIAIEFDTRLDVGFDDPSNNHVGFDIDGPVSLRAVDVSAAGIELRSGDVVTTWIDYHHDQCRLEVWLGYASNKPQSPIISAKIELWKSFQELMYVGFSASTEGSTEVHMIQNWSFNTFGFPIQSFTKDPNNFSYGTWSMMPSLPANSSSSGPRMINKPVGISLVFLGLVVFSIAFVALCCIALLKWIKIKMMNEGFQQQELLKGPRRFSYRELRTATKGFHSSRVIGNGAFGMVYQAIHMQSGITYAVKRSKQAQDTKTEFVAELSIIASLRHKNLVRLEGWCTEKGELLLVYEFMPNGSLDKLLYSKPGSGNYTLLSWRQRYNAAVGIASVLSYLHQECEQQVIHRDIKTSNIMLDAEFNPRLGDFGLARLMNHNESPVSTLTAGTMGYLAPEYLQYGKATEKTDVFSYGVVVLEVCCGRRPIEREDGKEGNMVNMVNLVDWVWRLYSEGRLIEAVDQSLNGDFDKEKVERLLLVGLSCANPDCSERPSMRKVVQILNLEAEPMAVPRMKPLLVFASGAALALQEIGSDCEESRTCSPLYELKSQK